MRAARIALAALAAVVLCALLALWQGPRILDWDHYRSAVERVASAGLGRPVRIAGGIRLSLLPEATLRATEVSVADAGDGAAAEIGALRMRIGLRALLRGRIEPRELVMQDARMTLPWPLAGFTLHAPGAPGLQVGVEDGTLQLGGLAVGGITGTLRAGRDGDALSAAGFGTVMGRRWQITGRLGRPGGDGSATVDLSLDGQDADIGTGARLSGQLAADGSVTGRITGRGSDLSRLLNAPPLAWSADGRLVASGGLIVADDLELGLGGVPARGAVALRLLPLLRLDVALAASRLDLDAWLPPVLRGGTVSLPTGIDLSAEAASLAGGTLRRLRAGFDITRDGVALRPSDAVLPGDAVVHLAGMLANGTFRGEGRLQAPDLPATLDWLRPRAPELLRAVPVDAMRTAELAARVEATGGTLGLGGLTGTVAGVAVSGDIAIRAAPRPAAAVNLLVTAPVLDGWLAALPDSPAGAASAPAALSRWAAGCDADIELRLDRPVWRGARLKALTVHARAADGALSLPEASLTARGVRATLTGELDRDGRLTAGHAAVSLADAGIAAGLLPPGLAGAAPLLHGPATVDVTAAGTPAALSVSAEGALSDATLRLTGTLDLPGARWGGSVALHHPGAPRLLSSLGLAGVGAWAGDGSLSLQAAAEAGPESVRLRRLDVTAGSLHASGDLAWSWPAGRPLLEGALAFDTLPVAFPYVHSTNPLPLDALRTADVRLDVRTSHLQVAYLTEGGPASARITAEGGVLHVDAVSARLADGALSGTALLATDGVPALTVDASLSGVRIDGPLSGAALDVTAGRVDAVGSLRASGYSPAAMLASLAGSVRMTAQDGTLRGLALGRVAAALSAPGELGSGMTAALGDGATGFATLRVGGTIGAGLLTLTEASADTASGTLAASGQADLSAGTMDVTLRLRTLGAGAPAVRLRLIGPAAAPTRTADIGALLREMAERGGPGKALP